MKIINRKKNISNNHSYLQQQFKESILEAIRDEKANAFIKSGTFSTEIIWNRKSFIFPNQKEKDYSNFKKGLFLFGMVRSDAKKFMASNSIKIPKRYNSIFYNEQADINFPNNITGTDMNHAYWRIAFNKGIISENTYTKGLPDEYKSTRLAALSTLGRKKQYQVIKNGELTKDLMVIQGDERLEKVYIFIRLTCYKYMNDLKKMLGKDFLAYKTDCIYYIDTPMNREIVNQYFHNKGLLVKQLI